MFTLLITAASGQILEYEVVKGNKKLGKMTVDRRYGAKTVEYHLKSRVVFRLLFSFTVDYESNSFYENGTLAKEWTISKLNGSTQKESTILKKDPDYELTLNGVRSSEKAPITYSIAAIYYEEPYDGQKVFSPQFGQYLTFKQVAPHQYEMESPDGTNLYTYANGICIEVKVSRDFARFYFKMSPETLYAVKNRADSIVGGN